MHKKKAVWITGASSGIGKAISLEFISNGLTILASSRNLHTLNSIRESLGEKEDQFIPIELDITDKLSVIDVYQKFSHEYEVEGLINNAGVTSFKKALDDSVEEIENIIRTNLLGAVYTIKAVLPDFIERKSGKILNILSVVANKIFLASSAYSASKSGLLAYTNVLREELRGSNIRIINILPGATNTNIWHEKVLEKYSEQMMKPEEIAKIVHELYSVNSLLVPEEIVLRPIRGDL